MSLLVGGGAGGTEVARKTWLWSPTWSEVMGVGGIDTAAANRRAYAGVLQGIASSPKPKLQPKLWPKPAGGGTEHPHATNARDAFTKAVGAIRPTLDMQGTVC